MITVTKLPGRTAADTLFDEIRNACLSGRFAEGSRLPSQRRLAQELALSRGVVTEALERLQDEGYLETRHGAGTFVAALEPIERITTSEKEEDVGPKLSARGMGLVSTDAIRADGPLRPLAPGIPALDHFPWKAWAACRREAQILASAAAGLGPMDPQGDPNLRDAISRHVSAMRGVNCTAEQIIIIPSSRTAAAIAGLVLADPGDAVAVESPGFPGALGGFTLAGLRILPTGLDDAGIMPDLIGNEARLIYVSPSHQYPLGTVMTLERRLSLLTLARERESWIIEDDYDGEFRYEGKPITALQGLADSQNVIYVGTFSKAVFPALRLAYVVVPPAATAAFVQAKTALDGFSSPIDQRTLATFISSGGLARHIRKMRGLYSTRRRAIIEACARYLPPECEIKGQEAGLHVTILLPSAIDDKDLASRLRSRGIAPAPLSRYSLGDAVRPGLVCGFANANEAALDAAIRLISEELSA